MRGRGEGTDVQAWQSRQKHGTILFHFHLSLFHSRVRLLCWMHLPAEYKFVSAVASFRGNSYLLLFWYMHACLCLFLLGLFCISGSFARLNAPTSSSCARVNSSFAFLVWPGFGCQQVFLEAPRPLLKALASSF